jgi:hypothetical protein
MLSRRERAHQREIGHLLEPGDTVRQSLLLRSDARSMQDLVCVVSERHYYLVRFAPWLTNPEVLLFGPLGGDVRVERQGRFSGYYLVLEERRLALKRREIRRARRIAAAVASRTVAGPVHPARRLND